MITVSKFMSKVKELSMKVLLINGSPRKTGNIATLLNNAIQGVTSQNVEAEIVHLYDYNFKGCISCFACKRKDGKSYGKCAVQDELTSILKKIEEADALIIGSPLYFGNVTGEVRSFLERLQFPYSVYDKNYSSLFPRKMQVGFIFAMNVTNERLEVCGYKESLSMIEQTAGRIFGDAESLFVTDTYQFDDYSKYEVTAFDPELKSKRREEEFPKDCKKAFDMGEKFARQVLES
jgi:multimeric flavodoxin WrbA